MSNQKKQQEFIEMLQSVCEELGWVIGIPSDEESDAPVDGLIIGTEKFIYGVVSAVRDNYDVYSKNMGEDLTPLPPPKKKVTFH